MEEEEEEQEVKEEEEGEEGEEEDEKEEEEEEDDDDEEEGEHRGKPVTDWLATLAGWSPPGEQTRAFGRAGWGSKGGLGASPGRTWSAMIDLDSGVEAEWSPKRPCWKRC